MDFEKRWKGIDIDWLMSPDNQDYLKNGVGLCSLISELWGYSSVGRAPALQAGGQEFESPYLHHAGS